MAAVTAVWGSAVTPNSPEGNLGGASRGPRRMEDARSGSLE